MIWSFWCLVGVQSHIRLLLPGAVHSDLRGCAGLTLLLLLKEDNAMGSFLRERIDKGEVSHCRDDSLEVFRKVYL